MDNTQLPARLENPRLESVAPVIGGEVRTSVIGEGMSVQDNRQVRNMLEAEWKKQKKNPESRPTNSFSQLVDRASEAHLGVSGAMVTPGGTRGNATVMGSDGLVSPSMSQHHGDMSFLFTRNDVDNQKSFRANNRRNENELNDPGMLQTSIPPMPIGNTNAVMPMPDRSVTNMPRSQLQIQNLQGVNWDKNALAQALGLPPSIANVPIVSQVLQCLVNTNVNPKSVTPSRSRKRQDYNCGKCGKRKKGHVCEHRDISEAQPAPKRRKYKPLQPFLYENGDRNTQSALISLNKLGIDNVFVRLNVTEHDDVIAAYQQTAFHQPTYIGRLSPEYKELVKPAILDHTVQKVGLNPLTRVTLDNGHTIWTAQLNIFRNQSWHTKKLVEKYFSGSSTRGQGEPLPPPSTTRPKPRRGVVPHNPLIGHHNHDGIVSMLATRPQQNQIASISAPQSVIVPNVRHGQMRD